MKTDIWGFTATVVGTLYAEDRPQAEDKLVELFAAIGCTIEGAELTSFDEIINADDDPDD